MKKGHAIGVEDSSAQQRLHVATEDGSLLIVVEIGSQHHLPHQSSAEMVSRNADQLTLMYSGSMVNICARFND